MTKKRKKPKLEITKQVGKLFVLRPTGYPAEYNGIRYSTLNVRRADGGVFRTDFHPDSIFMFLGIGKSVGRRFISGFGSQRIYKFLFKENIIETVLYDGEFDNIFEKLTNKC